MSSTGNKMRVVYLPLYLSERAYNFLKNCLWPLPLSTELPAVPDRRLLEVKELLRPDEVANILRISLGQVYYLARLGELEAVRIRGALRIKSRSVLKIIDGEGERG